MMNHQSGNARCQGLVEFVKERLPAVLRRLFLAGMQIDIGEKIGEAGDRGKFGAPIARDGDKTLIPQDSKGFPVKAVPGWGKDRQKMVAEDVLQLVLAADDIAPFLFKACPWPEFLLFASDFVVMVVPAVLVPGEKLVITVDQPFHVLPSGAIEPGGNESGACPATWSG